jgi:very-short-patch-repair endonuclease
LPALRELAVTDAALDTWVRRGRLHVVHRGVYAVGHRVLRVDGRRLAAVLACGPGAVLSHRAAAAHWELLAFSGSLVDVTAPATRHGVPGVRLHRSRSLDARDATHHQGIPITTVARTLLDVAATVQSHLLERALAQAERLQLYDHRAITDVIARSNGHRGVATLAGATAREPKWTRNEREAHFLTLVRDAGLTEPLVNEAFDAPDHGRCEPDFHWPAYRLIVETDGWETHGTRAAFEADRRKDAALVAAGYVVLRFTWREVRDHPQTVADRLRAGCCRACASARAGAWSAASPAR